MIVPLTKQEVIPLVKGVSLLVAVVVIGVAGAEYQLNNLTMQSTYNKAFNIQRHEATYTIYILGKEGQFSARYSAGRIVRSGQAIVINNNMGQVAVPTAVTVDLHPALYWVEKWKGQFVVEAHKTKEALFHYFKEIEPFLMRGKEWVTHRIGRISQILAGFSQ